MTVFILMGVAGSGKTTVGKRASEQLGIRFYEGDDYHPEQNVAKMSSGIPLTDSDRGPWIDALVAELNARPNGKAIVACSALSKFVRERIRSGLKESVEFIWLSGDPELIEKRLQNRPKHYMKAGMLASQFAALQLPESAHRVSVEQSLEDVVAQVVGIINSKG
jgi:gluconokinase